MDYIVTDEKWKNNFKNIESDLMGRLSKPNADHYPLTATINIRLRAMKKKARRVGREKIAQINDEVKIKYNDELRLEQSEWTKANINEEEEEEPDDVHPEKSSVNPYQHLGSDDRRPEGVLEGDSPGINDKGKGVLEWSGLINFEKKENELKGREIRIPISMIEQPPKGKQKEKQDEYENKLKLIEKPYETRTPKGTPPKSQDSVAEYMKGYEGSGMTWEEIAQEKEMNKEL